NPGGPHYSWDGQGLSGTMLVTAAIRSYKDAQGVCHDDFPNGQPHTGLVTIYRPVSASPAGGTYVGTQAVTLSAAAGVTIYYTLDGSTPTTGSPAYVAPLTFMGNATIKALGVDQAGNAGAVQTFNYVIQNPLARSGCGEATCTPSQGASTSHFIGAGCTG